MDLSIESSMQPWHQHGVRFLYPDVWELEESTDGEDIIVSVSSEGTAFWALRILWDCPPPPQVVDSCIDGFREEYDEVDVSDVTVPLAGMPAFARDVEFTCFELLNTAALHSVRTTDFTLLVWWQGTDQELEEFSPLLKSMTASVQVDSLMDD